MVMKPRIMSGKPMLYGTSIQCLNRWIAPDFSAPWTCGKGCAVQRGRQVGLASVGPREAVAGPGRQDRHANHPGAVPPKEYEAMIGHSYAMGMKTYAQSRPERLKQLAFLLETGTT